MERQWREAVLVERIRGNEHEKGNLEISNSFDLVEKAGEAALMRQCCWRGRETGSAGESVSLLLVCSLSVHLAIQHNPSRSQLLALLHNPLATCKV